MSEAPGGTTPAELERRLERLERTVDGLAGRLAAFEARAGAGAEAPPAGIASRPDEEPTARPTPEPAPGPRPEPSGGAVADGLRGVPALLGRTCLVLGGAFLVRSLTESETLTAGVGVAVGIVYAAVWLALADRAAARGQVLGGAFHALASALIVYPLLLEAATRFALLDPWTAALLLAVATGAGLAVAWRRSFHAVAWITLIAALAVATLLLFRTRTPLPFVIDLLLFAAASLALAYGRGWRGQRWLVALAADAVVLLLGALWLVPKAPPAWLATGPVLAAQIGLAAIYLGAFVLRLLFQGREVTPFALVQTVLALAIGFEGALALGDGAVRTGLAIAALATGALLHGVLARRSEQRFGHGFAVGYFSTVATYLAAEGTRVLLPATIYAPLWLAAAAALAALAIDGRRPILQVHAALLALAGAIASGLGAAALAAFTRPGDADWPPFTVGALAVLGLAAATAVLLYRGAPAGRGNGAATAARLTALGVALVGLGGWVSRLLAAALAGAPGPDARAGAVAVVRSAVLAVAAVALAAAARALGRAELARAAAAVLVAAGLKLLFEDLRVGGAAHLVFSLALYGTALIVVPALTRHVKGPPREDAQKGDT